MLLLIVIVFIHVLTPNIRLLHLIWLYLYILYIFYDIIYIEHLKQISY